MAVTIAPAIVQARNSNSYTTREMERVVAMTCEIECLAMLWLDAINTVCFLNEHASHSLDN